MTPADKMLNMVEALETTMQTSFFVITLILFFYIGLTIYKKAIYGFSTNSKKQYNNQSVSSNKKENQEKSNSSMNIDVQVKQPKKTIFRPNVDNILSMIQYIEDLQKQIKNSLNINDENQSTLILSRIDQSIFVKFNILKEKFMLDYQAIDWNSETNTNQEISNSYQKIYDEHEKLLKEQYDDIKQYLKEYLHHQVVQSKEELDVINKIIN